MFAVDEGLLRDARDRLAAWPGLRFVTGGAGTGKSTVCTRLAARLGLGVLDVDARLYGSWHGRFDAGRHPVNHAWSAAPDALAWQLALDPTSFLGFHAAATAEALDLLADDLAADAVDPAVPLLADGGFGSVAVLARAVSADRIACLVLPPALRDGAWTRDEDRRGFLGVVAAVSSVAEPVARFLALDRALSERMEADSRAASVPIVVRGPGDTPDATARAVTRLLGLD